MGIAGVERGRCRPLLRPAATGCQPARWAVARLREPHGNRRAHRLATSRSAAMARATSSRTAFSIRRGRLLLQPLADHRLQQLADHLLERPCRRHTHRLGAGRWCAFRHRQHRLRVASARTCVTGKTGSTSVAGSGDFAAKVGLVVGRDGGWRRRTLRHWHRPRRVDPAAIAGGASWQAAWGRARPCSASGSAFAVVASPSLGAERCAAPSWPC